MHVHNGMRSSAHWPTLYLYPNQPQPFGDTQMAKKKGSATKGGKKGDKKNQKDDETEEESLPQHLPLLLPPLELAPMPRSLSPAASIPRTNDFAFGGGTPPRAKSPRSELGWPAVHAPTPIASRFPSRRGSMEATRDPFTSPSLPKAQITYEPLPRKPASPILARSWSPPPLMIEGTTQHPTMTRGKTTLGGYIDKRRELLDILKDLHSTGYVPSAIRIELS